MADVIAPAARPANTHFSSGPCSKRPGWSLDALSDAPLGRSHRAKVGKEKLKLAIDLTREILKVPADYRIGIVPASDTGAVEMAMWSLLGERGVDMLSWESFGAGWVTDVVKQLKLADVRKFNAPTASAGSRSRRFRPRRRLHLERHDIWRPRAERRLHPRRPQGPDHLRRHLCRLCTGPGLRQARCHHLLLAEGSGRRGRSRCAHPFPARRRAL
jgi:hypothetical protein